MIQDTNLQTNLNSVQTWVTEVQLSNIVSSSDNVSRQLEEIHNRAWNIVNLERETSLVFWMIRSWTERIEGLLWIAPNAEVFGKMLEALKAQRLILDGWPNYSGAKTSTNVISINTAKKEVKPDDSIAPDCTLKHDIAA